MTDWQILSDWVLATAARHVRQGRLTGLPEGAGVLREQPVRHRHGQRP